MKISELKGLQDRHVGEPLCSSFSEGSPNRRPGQAWTAENVILAR